MRALTCMALTFVLIAGAAHAEQGGGPRERAEAFLARVGKGDIGPAYDDLFAGSPVLTAKPQALDALKRQTAAGLPLYGKVLGFELQDEKTFGTSITRLTYIQKLEQHPLVWRFWFYKPADAWFVDNVAFNDQFNHLQGD